MQQEDKISNYSQEDFLEVDFFVDQKFEKDDTLIQNLNYFSFYNSNQNSQNYYLYQDCVQLVDQIVEKIIDNGSTKLYNDYIVKKLPSMITDFLIQHYENGVQNYQTAYDNISNEINIDDEPNGMSRDNFNRGQINSLIGEKQIKFEKQSKQDRSSEQMVSSMNSTIRSQKQFELQCLEPKREVDTAEEQLRSQKEREEMILKEKLALQKKRERELQQQKLKMKNDKNVNNQNVTFDYDGQIIYQNTVDTKKLPPSTYNIGYDVKSIYHEIVEEKQLKQEQNTKSAKQSVKKQKVVPDAGIKFQQISPSIFQNFEPNKGVSLIQGAQMVGGESHLNMTKLSLVDLSLHQPKSQSLKLSKSEYLNLTRVGNLSRSNMQNGIENDTIDGQIKETIQEVDYSSLEISNIQCNDQANNLKKVFQILI